MDSDHANVIAPPPLTYVPPLFWAGEATHTRGHAACVHGALETGRRAAFEALHAIQSMYAAGPETPLDWQRYTAHMLE